MGEPLEERLVPLETTRHVSIITITLSKIELDMSSIGNQPPLPVNQVKVGSHNGRDGRRRPMSRGNVEYEDGGGNHNRGYGRGRGRGSRGRGRGGYNGQLADRMEDGGYNYEVPPQGGRGKELEIKMKKLCDLSSLSQAYVFYKLSQTQVISFYNSNLSFNIMEHLFFLKMNKRLF
ncbi:hypothetical protein V6Z11_D01G048000 [Gossypium hirsutum]